MRVCDVINQKKETTIRKNLAFNESVNTTNPHASGAVDQQRSSIKSAGWMPWH